jgi:hypothetical protein
MANNLIVDVGAINGAIAEVNKIYAAAKEDRFYIDGVYCAPIEVDSKKAMRMEAFTSNMSSWNGWGTATLSLSGYVFKNNFSMTPIVTATYDGSHPGVTLRVVAKNQGAKDTVTIYAYKPDKWPKNKETNQFVHVIVVGY